MGPTPIVLLHGYVGDGLATWRDQLGALTDEYTVVVAGRRRFGRSAESLRIAGYDDSLAGFIAAFELHRPRLAGLSFAGARHRRRRPSPRDRRSLILVSAYAGWAGSLPGDVVEQRLAHALTLSQLTATEFVDTLLPTMFATRPDPDVVDRFAASMHGFHPVGFRAMARASAEDLRHALPAFRRPDAAHLR